MAGTCQIKYLPYGEMCVKMCKMSVYGYNVYMWQNQSYIVINSSGRTDVQRGKFTHPQE